VVAAAGGVGRRPRSLVTAAAPLVVHTEAPIGFGGQEIRILAEARWLAAHGWTALIVCQPGSALEREATSAAVDVAPLRMRSAADVPALLSLRRLLRRRGAALIHTHSSIDSWVGGIAARSLRLPEPGEDPYAPWWWGISRSALTAMLRAARFEPVELWGDPFAVHVIARPRG